MQELPDSLLLDRIAGQDKAAFSELYDRYADRLFGLALRMLRDEALAEDAVQDTFLALWRKAYLYRKSRGLVITWLYRICRNCCLDRLKRAESRREKSIAPAQLAESALKFLSGDADTPVPEIEDRVVTAVAGLSENERMLIELAFFTGKSHGEIAAETQLPLGTVKSRIAAALKKLRRELGDLWSSRGDWS